MATVAVLLALVLAWVLWSSLRDALRKPRARRPGAATAQDAGAESYLLHSMLYAGAHDPASDAHHGGTHDAGHHHDAGGGDAGGFDAGGHDAGCADAGGGDAGGGDGGGGGGE